MKHWIAQFTILVIVYLSNQSILTKNNNSSQHLSRRILTQQGSILEQQVNGKNGLRLAVFDGQKQVNDNFLQSWETRENGSIGTGIEAYKVYEQPLTIDFLKQVRIKFAAQDSGNYSEQSKYEDRDDVTQFTEKAVAFGLNNPSEDQLQQIELHNEDLKKRLQIALENYGKYVDELRENLKQQKKKNPNNNFQDQENNLKTFEEKYIDYQLNLNQLYDANLALNKNKDELEFELELLEESQNPYRLDKGKYQQRIYNNVATNAKQRQGWIELLFFQYELDTSNLFQQQIDLNDPIQKENQETQFLTYLSTLIIDLERQHPFLDFNCRTFAVLLLNKELIRRNFSASVMQDPNQFDYLTVQESVEKIRQGQENFQNLVQNGKLHDIDPDDYTMLKNVNFLPDISDLFCIRNGKTHNVNDVYIYFIEDLKINQNEANIESNDINEFKLKLVQILKQHPFSLLIKQQYGNSMIMKNQNDNNQEQQQQGYTIDQILEEIILNSFECKSDFQQRTYEEVKQIYDHILSSQIKTKLEILL